MEASDWSIRSMEAPDSLLAVGIMEYQTLIEKYSLESWKHLAAHWVHHLNGRDQKLFGEMIFQISLSILKLRNHGTSRDMRLRIFSCHPPPGVLLSVATSEQCHKCTLPLSKPITDEIAYTCTYQSARIYEILRVNITD